MPLTSPPEQGSIRPPHPLALRLVAAEHDGRPGLRVLDFGTGSGRNAAALRAAGFAVAATPDGQDGGDLEAGVFAAALSTHALLHGTPEDIARCLRHIGRALVPGANLYATFASTRDARFGTGRRLRRTTFAPTSGDERDVAHSYFDRRGIGELLDVAFEVASLEEVNVDTIAGKWAHVTPLQGAVHWFVEAAVRKRLP